MTRIEWCDATWNPVTGCSPISEGCANCYAKRMATRLRGRCGYDAKDPFRVTLHSDRLAEPKKWRKPRRVFVCSMGDLFHKDVPSSYINKIWNVAFNFPRDTWIFLTKRPLMLMRWTQLKATATAWPIDDIWPPWMWIGVSVENQEMAYERIPLLLKIPAAIRFVSVEPMLGPVDLGNYLCKTWNRKGLTFGKYLDWVISGAETGPGKRLMSLDWARTLRYE